MEHLTRLKVFKNGKWVKTDTKQKALRLCTDEDFKSEVEKENWRDTMKIHGHVYCWN